MIPAKSATATTPSPASASYSGPSLAIERFFATWDGVELFYRAWPAREPSNKAIILFHRGHEHSGRFQDLVDALHLNDYSIFAWDARGHGRSPGDRGYAKSFADLVRDADAFVRDISSEYGIPIENMAVVAHSVGSVLAAAWVHDYAPPIRALVLASPAFRVKLYIPFALFFLRIQHTFQPKAFVKSYVKAAMLTHDPEQRAAYQADPLITRSIAVNILIGMHDAATRLLSDASAIAAPTLMLVSGKDWVVKPAAQFEFFERLGSPVKQIEMYPGFFHDLLHEKDRAQPIEKVREFIVQRFEAPRFEPSLLDGSRNGGLYRELSRPLPALSPRGMFWSSQRLFLKTFGRLSSGIRLGWRHGFDSGKSLDYVYENAARGITPLGKLIDRIYLSSPGWRGIRQRKANLQTLLRTAIARAQAESGEARVLDIAAGAGRYVLEVLRELPEAGLAAELRDWDPANVEAARELASQWSVRNASFAVGDAFDRESLAATLPRPNVALVSGLYELFADNKMVLRSIEGVADALAPGGYFIYTNQPWHPQLEMIARVLVNRERRPWVMRCRSQGEMDELARAAGFEKLEMLIDEGGIFTVSLARKRAV